MKISNLYRSVRLSSAKPSQKEAAQDSLYLKNVAAIREELKSGLANNKTGSGYIDDAKIISVVENGEEITYMEAIEELLIREENKAKTKAAEPETNLPVEANRAPFKFAEIPTLQSSDFRSLVYQKLDKVHPGRKGQRLDFRY